MEVLYSINRLKERMNDKPKGSKLYNYFDGAVNHLTNEQRKELLEIIKTHNDEVVSFIESSIDQNEEE